nr:ATP-binding protein [uncultured Desulfobacter sp.]
MAEKTDPKKPEANSHGKGGPQIETGALRLLGNDEVYVSLFKENCAVMLMVDPDNLNIIDANQAALLFYGWTHEQIIRKKATDINNINESVLVPKIREAMHKKNSHFFTSHCMANGTIRDVEVYASPIILNGEKRIHAIIHDTTERKKAAKALARSEQKLAEQAIRTNHLASLGELAAGVAHEINNPVTGIISLAEVLMDKFAEDERERKIPEMIIHEGERISKIVKNLLSFAKDRDDDFRPVCVKDVLKLSVSLMERQILKDGIHLSIHLPQQPLSVNGRSHELQQVFMNIISNGRYAINARYPDPDENKIFEIHGKILKIQKQEYVRLIFFDRGSGIPSPLLDKITAPFFSTKPHDQGTGLGLSISHGIIDSHGGRLWFESLENEYTKVMVDLPLNMGRPLDESI